MSQDLAAWNRFAKQYHTWVGSHNDHLRTELLYPLLNSIITDYNPKTLLDIGCGNGLFANLMAQKGIHVSAFDGPAMILLAKEHFSHDLITFAEADATKPFAYANNSFDLATANLVLMDIAHIDITLQETARVLKESGIFIITILHPCFTPPVGRFRRGILGRINLRHAYFHLNNYFTPKRKNPSQVFGTPTPELHYYYRTISEYSQLFHQAGWHISKMHEPQASTEYISNHPKHYYASKVPPFLVFELTRGGSKP